MTHSFTLAASRREAPDRPHAVRDLDRGDALLSQRHLSALGRQRQGHDAARPSPPTAIAWRRSTCAQPNGAAGMPGVIVPRKTVGEVQRLIEDTEAEVAIELSQGKIRFTHRQCGADLEADRRHLPRLRPRHPAEQRQGTDRRQDRFRRRRRPRLDHFERARPRREARAVRGQAGAHRSPIRIPAAPPRSSRSNTPPTRSISASTRATCSTSPPRSRARSPCCSSPIPARRPWSRTATTRTRSTC